MPTHETRSHIGSRMHPPAEALAPERSWTKKQRPPTVIDVSLEILEEMTDCTFEKAVDRAAELTEPSLIVLAHDYTPEMRAYRICRRVA